MSIYQCNNNLKIEGLKLMMFFGKKDSFFIGNILHCFIKLEKMGINSWMTDIPLWLIDKTEVFKRNKLNDEDVDLVSLEEKNRAFKKETTTVALLTLKEVFLLINKGYQIKITIKKYKAV